MLKGEGPYAIVQYVRLSYNLVPAYLSSGFSAQMSSPLQRLSLFSQSKVASSCFLSSFETKQLNPTVCKMTEETRW